MIYFLLLVIWVLVGFLSMFLGAAGGIMGPTRQPTMFQKIARFPAYCVIYVFKRVF